MKGLSFDTIILDETFGYKDVLNKDHHNIPLFLETIQRFKEKGMVKSSTKIFANHMSHHNPPHDKLTNIMKKHNVYVAYDGLEVLL